MEKMVRIENALELRVIFSNTEKQPIFVGKIQLENAFKCFENTVDEKLNDITTTILEPRKKHDETTLHQTESYNKYLLSTKATQDFLSSTEELMTNHLKRNNGKLQN